MGVLSHLSHRVWMSACSKNEGVVNESSLLVATNDTRREEQ